MWTVTCHPRIYEWHISKTKDNLWTEINELMSVKDIAPF